MFKNWRIDNAVRKNFSAEFIQVPKSKWGYARNLNFLGNTYQKTTVIGKNKWRPDIPISETTVFNGVYTSENLTTGSFKFYPKASREDIESAGLILKPDTLYTITIVITRNTLLRWLQLDFGAGGAWTNIDETGSESATNPGNMLCSAGFVGTTILKRRTRTESNWSNYVYGFRLDSEFPTSTPYQKMELEYKIMIQEGNVDGTFEPYIYTSPSPTHPQPINSVPSSFNITACGKNLVNLKGVLEYWQCTYLSSNETMIITSTANSGVCFVGTNLRGLPVGNYSIAFNRVGAGYVTIVAYDFLGNIVKASETFFSSGEYSLIEGTYRLRVYMYGNTASVGAITEYQNFIIAKSPVLLSYTPYIGSTTPITFRDTDGNLHDLSSLPDGTADSIDVYSGQGVDIQKTVIVTSGTSPYAWEFVSSNATTATIRMADTSNKWSSALGSNANIFCSIANGTVGGGKDTTFIYRGTNSSDIYIVIDVSSLSEVNTAGVQAYINKIISDTGKPIIFKYPLATPITWTLHPDERKKIITVDNTVCNIFTDAEVQPTIELNAISYGE